MDLSTNYMGLRLKHPLVASASPLSHRLDGIRGLEDAGASAVVLHSLFEEQIEIESHLLDHYLDYGSESFAEALSYFPKNNSYNLTPDEYLDLVRAAKEAVDIPVMGSLNGISTGGWTRYARLIEQAGADGLELNIYHLPTDPSMDAVEVEKTYLDIVAEVRKTVKLPLAIKVGPFFSAFANMAGRLATAGANALVLFNRFYQPDIDLERLEVVPNLELSHPGELRLPLRWVAILHGRLAADLAITGGVHDATAVLKGVMAGAAVTMMASELLQNGVSRLGRIREDVERWMEEHEYDSIGQMLGSMSQKKVADPESFERANYMKTLQSWRPDPVGGPWM